MTVIPFSCFVCGGMQQRYHKISANFTAEKNKALKKILHSPFIARVSKLNRLQSGLRGSVRFIRHVIIASDTSADSSWLVRKWEIRQPLLMTLHSHSTDALLKSKAYYPILMTDFANCRLQGLLETLETFHSVMLKDNQCIRVFFTT